MYSRPPPARHREARGLKGNSARREYGIPVAQGRDADLAVAEKLGREEVTDPARPGDGIFETVGLREGREVRQEMSAVDVAEVEHALHAEHQILAGDQQSQI